MLRDETIALAYKFKQQNHHSQTSWVRHELYVDMIHDFQIASAFLPAARLSVKQIQRFINELLGDQVAKQKAMHLSPSEVDLMRMIDSHLEHE
jgi:acetyl esterase/lipase